MAQSIQQPAEKVLARARLIKTLALGLSLATFAFLAVSFGWQWKPYIQFPAGIACYLALSWFQKSNRHLSSLESGREENGNATGAA
jgi:hypothetical protein